jgi:hypothetical protein
MTRNLLIPNECGCPVGEYIKSLSDFGHLLGNHISPKGIAILVVKLKGFFDGPWYFNAKFVGPL